MNRILALLTMGIIACGERPAEDRRAETAAPDTLAAASSDTAPEPTAGETLAWTNDRSRLSGDKLENFIAFTFRHPASWRVIEDGSGDTPNFVKVEHATENGITIENFAVGWYTGVDADEVAAAIEPQFAASFPSYAKLADETMLIDGAESRGFSFQTVVETTDGPMRFWGRVLARPVEPTRGILVVMFASQIAPGIEGPADLGRRGELPVILASLRVGDE